PTKAPKTYAQYEFISRLYLIPGLGKHQLTRLTVPIIRIFLNQQLAAGRSLRHVHLMKVVLSSALSCAQTEERVFQNSASLVKLKKYKRPSLHPWSLAEAEQFLEASRSHPFHAIFVLLTVYGLRCGEALGVRWQDIDMARGVLHIRQQVQRVGQTVFVG